MLTPAFVQKELTELLSELQSFEHSLQEEHPEIGVDSIKTDLYYNFKPVNGSALNLKLQKFLIEFAAANIFSPVTSHSDTAITIFDLIEINAGTFGLSCADIQAGHTGLNSDLLHYYRIKTGAIIDHTENLNAFYRTLAVCFIQKFLPGYSSPMLLWHVERACGRILTNEQFGTRDAYKMIEAIEVAIISILPKTALLDLALKADSLPLERYCQAAKKAQSQPDQAAALLAAGNDNMAWYKLFISSTALDQPAEITEENCVSEYGFYSQTSFRALFGQKDLNVFDIIGSGLSPLHETNSDQGRSVLHWLATSSKYSQIALTEFDYLDYKLSITPAFDSRVLIERNINDVVPFFDKAIDLFREDPSEFEFEFDLDDSGT